MDQKFITITFGHGTNDKAYGYKLAPQLNDAEIKEGDKIVCQTGDNESVMVGRVLSLGTTDESLATKWAFQLVDNDLNKSLPRG